MALCLVRVAYFWTLQLNMSQTADLHVFNVSSPSSNTPERLLAVLEESGRRIFLEFDGGIVPAFPLSLRRLPSIINDLLILIGLSRLLFLSKRLTRLKTRTSRFTL
jgi:hypothetical protein